MLESEPDTQSFSSLSTSSTELDDDGDNEQETFVANTKSTKKYDDSIIFVRSHFLPESSSFAAAGTNGRHSIPLQLKRHVRCSGDETSYLVYVDIGRSLLRELCGDSPRESSEVGQLPFVSRHEALVILHFKPSCCGATPSYCHAFSIIAKASQVSFRSTALLPNHRYRVSASEGATSMRVAIGGKWEVELSLIPNTDFSPLRETTLHAIKVPPISAPAAEHTKAKEKQSDRVQHKRGARPGLANRKFVVYTTGIHLTASEEAQCKRLGVLLNPNLKRAPEAEVLVVGETLIRSVKLLAVLPHVHDIVDHSWLREVMRTKSTSVALPPHRFEAKPSTHQSVETANGFTFKQLLAVPRESRKQLFSSEIFWVHEKVTPQDAPLNDAKVVITSSGGKVTRRASEATVLVVPPKRPRGEQWEETGLPGTAQTRRTVTVDDIFRSVFQQRKIAAAAQRNRLSDGAKNGTKHAEA